MAQSKVEVPDVLPNQPELPKELQSSFLPSPPATPERKAPCKVKESTQVLTADPVSDDGLTRFNNEDVERLLKFVDKLKTKDILESFDLPLPQVRMF